MKRKLLKQMRNEWRTNIWLALELLIISSVLWYIADYTYCQMAVLNEPLGFEYDHCYIIDFNTLDEKSDDFNPDRTSSEAQIEDMSTLLQRLGDRPEIEAVAATLNSMPYGSGNMGTNLVGDSIAANANGLLQWMVTPSFAEVFKIRGLNGESPQQVAAMLNDNPAGFLSSGDIFDVGDIDALVGKTFENQGNGVGRVTLIGRLRQVKYSDYQPAEMSKMVLMPLSHDNLQYADQIVVRVKDNYDKDFVENLMHDSFTSLKSGNIYITGARSLSDIRYYFNRNNDATMRNFMVGAVFLLFNVFLGMLGTFWFRTNQRAPEIAIRRVNGATSACIFRRVVSEGLLLLTVVTPVAIAIDYALVACELNSSYGGSNFEPLRFSICAFAAYCLMAVMIILGTVIPAWRTLSLKPAAVLAEN